MVAETGSTNSDLLAEAKRGRAEGAVLAAETQSAGRGRLGRHWVSPPRAALMFSVLLRPQAVPPAEPRLAAAAGRRGRGARRCAARAGVDAWLKWPNDVQVNGAKLAGILAEQAGDAIVVGTGINVSAGRDELPADGTTSLALEGARSRTGTGCWSACSGSWSAGTGPGRPRGDADGCGLRPEYRRLCGTLGRQVRVSLPGGGTLTGAACEVDRAGRLVVRSASGSPRSAPGTWSMSGDAGPHRAVIRVTMWRMAGDESLSEGEHFVLRLHPHWKTLLRPFLILRWSLAAAIAALILLPSGSSAGVARDAIGVVVFLAVIIWCVVPLLRWQTTSYELTTRRLRLRMGILSRSGRDFPLIRISDVSFSHGPIDRLLGCGRLTVESAGEHGQLVLTEIPQVEQVQATAVPAGRGRACPAGPGGSLRAVAMRCRLACRV